MIEIYTDGGCKGNGNLDAIGGLGVAFFKSGKCFKKISKTYKETTNNRMEYSSMIIAMETAIREKWQDVVFYSDSKLLLSTITDWMSGWQKKGWKKGGSGSKSKIKNLDLVLRLWELKKELPNAKFVWVKGHSGNEGNELADELTNAIEIEKAITDEVDYKILEKYNVTSNLAPR